MESLIEKYEGKLIEANLVDEGKALFGAVNVKPVWNRSDRRTATLARLLDDLSIVTIICAEPAEPYRSMVKHIAASSGDCVKPHDNETRTFLHDIPVVGGLTSLELKSALSHRKGAVSKEGIVIATGTVSPEQAYVTFSSICFAFYVKYLGDYLLRAREGNITRREQNIFRKIVQKIPEGPKGDVRLMRAPFESEQKVLRAIEEAGAKTVHSGLVDSSFGNISYRYGGILYISQTGCPLDELAGHIDPCPLDGSSCVAITASSELPAHLTIVTENPVSAVLHGHPKFSVIMSLLCEKADCNQRGTRCHHCPEVRYIEGIPIVAGDVGAGLRGIHRAVQPLMAKHRGVVVYGHGVFSTGRYDFNEAYDEMARIENTCRNRYFNATDVS
ncbi:MAG: class II aldolase/adducin family protein [Deltaproteobacteria bacterium]|nr:class II aldolase/adducin family protein [Deltaproteobacteria bacterium]